MGQDLGAEKLGCHRPDADKGDERKIGWPG